ncbi:hypothetical protein Pmani_018719 [Petrolisthes manimaculis]|uniref:Uncharacterized protein n=1 Tax=Petrolisthes manimaculis TaxID=1843537 RepID=A0AAE1PM77_9EUCA|nr:hypothetical protein Pmani_018719 [Petrolisthes manimaculis]
MDSWGQVVQGATEIVDHEGSSKRIRTVSNMRLAMCELGLVLYLFLPNLRTGLDRERELVSGVLRERLRMVSNMRLWWYGS